MSTAGVILPEACLAHGRRCSGDGPPGGQGCVCVHEVCVWRMCVFVSSVCEHGITVCDICVWSVCICYV